MLKFSSGISKNVSDMSYVGPKAQSAWGRLVEVETSTQAKFDSISHVSEEPVSIITENVWLPKAMLVANSSPSKRDIMPVEDEFVVLFSNPAPRFCLLLEYEFLRDSSKDRPSVVLAVRPEIRSIFLLRGITVLRRGEAAEISDT